MNRRGTTICLRRGLTLVELLVVVFIILLITAITIPIIAPSGEQRQIRETSRLVTGFFQGARTRAIQTGRPFGVIIEPLLGETRAALQLSYAEVQAPYAGDFIASRLNFGVVQDSSTASIYYNQVSAPSDTWAGLIKDGDLLKLDYQGHFYVLRLNTAQSVWYIGVGTDLNNDGTPDTWSVNSQTTNRPVFRSGVAYQIFRQPVKTSAQPLELPNGMAIDLEYSGTPGNPTLEPLTNQTGPYGIIFTPGGSVSAIYHAGGSPNPVIPTGPIFLLIGKRAYIPTNLDYNPPDDPVQYNYQDFTNVWVTIQHQTGLVTSTEVGGTADVATSRSLAQKALTLGGK